jgi:hypothetical protein
LLAFLCEVPVVWSFIYLALGRVLGLIVRLAHENPRWGYQRRGTRHQQPGRRLRAGGHAGRVGTHGAVPVPVGSAGVVWRSGSIQRLSAGRRYTTERIAVRVAAQLRMLHDRSSRGGRSITH